MVPVRKRVSFQVGAFNEGSHLVREAQSFGG